VTLPDAPGVHLDDPVAEDWMLPAIILAVTEHRRRIARLLGRLDELRRDAVETGVAALEGGTVDAATLLATFSERIRTGDGQLADIVSELEAQGSGTALGRFTPHHPQGA
jgi:hypothetical protein